MIKLKELIENENIDAFVEALEIDPNVEFDSVDSKKYRFEVNGLQYEVVMDKKLMSNGKSIVESKFYLMNNPKMPKRKNFANDQQYQIALQKSQVGITGTGNYFLVFSKVLSIISKYCDNEKINYITFIADEENRQKLYAMILQKMITKYNIPYRRLKNNPIDGSSLGTEEFWVERI